MSLYFTYHPDNVTQRLKAEYQSLYSQ